MRNAFADEITRIAQSDPKVILLSGDIGNRLFDKLRDQRPKQFLNCGVAEQNMMSVAAGMGLSGLRPIVYTIAPFTTVRCLEQIKIDVAYHRAPVIIVGTGSGLSYASLGPTHHSLEDFAIFRAIPNFQILAPWDAPSLRACLSIALLSCRPTYIRIGKKGEPDLCKGKAVPSIGGSLTLRGGGHICILSVGTTALEAIKAGEILEKKGIISEVVVTHTVKPTPVDLFESLFNRFKLIVLVEEHFKIGGLGESIMSYATKVRATTKIIALGADDSFMTNIGTQEYARAFYRINSKAIISAVENELGCL